jgi:hypothetical protein
LRQVSQIYMAKGIGYKVHSIFFKSIHFFSPLHFFLKQFLSRSYRTLRLSVFLRLVRICFLAVIHVKKLEELNGSCIEFGSLIIIRVNNPVILKIK